MLEVNYQAERRQHAKARRAAFVVAPSGPNQVWQLDFTEFETRMGGSWRIGGVADYWSKLELGWHVSPTQNHHDAIAAVQIALEQSERLLGRPLLDAVTARKHRRAPSGRARQRRMKVKWNWWEVGGILWLGAGD